MTRPRVVVTRCPFPRCDGWIACPDDDDARHYASKADADKAAKALAWFHQDGDR